MSEERAPYSDNDDAASESIKRFEHMLKRNDEYYFDVQEFELMVDHYLRSGEAEKASKVIEVANLQHPNNVSLLLSQADVLLSQGHLNEALSIFDRLEPLEPNNGELFLQKASIYSQLRDHDKAISYYRKALVNSGEAKDELYLDLAFELQNAERIDEAIESLKAALTHNPSNEAVLYEIAYCYDVSGKNQEAILFFKKFLDEQPYSFVMWYNLGNALGRLSRFEEANDALDYCLAINDKFTTALLSKAHNLLRTRMYKEAIACYREHMDIEGPQAITFSYIGECYEKLDDHVNAVVNYNQAIALDPKWVDAYIGRGVVSDMLGRHSAAIKDLTQALKIDPENSDALYYLANTFGRTERFEDALEAYVKLNRLEPENLEGWLDHADLLLHLKGPESAVQKLRESEFIHKLKGAYRYRLVSYLLRSGRLQEGLEKLEEALINEPALCRLLLDHFPQVHQMPDAMHLISLYIKE